jgi:energy-converting hydrogenase Eha subunit A
MARTILVTAAVLLAIPLFGATALAATPATAGTSSAAAKPPAAASASPGATSPTAKLPPAGKAGQPATSGSSGASAGSAPVVPVHPTKNTCGALPKPGYSTCFAVKRTDVPAHTGLFAAATTPSGYGPSNLQSAYNLPSSTAGSGETVAIVDAFNDPTAEADLQVYRAQYGLPVCDTANGCFSKVAQDGSTNYPPVDAGWATEISLDLDMVSAICPNCHILLVEANDNSNTNLYTAENEAVTLGAKFVSNSWAGSEDPSQLTSDQTTFNHPGVVITAATGDSGYGPLYPATSQYVTAVGGTTLTQDSGVSRGWTESAWSGGGSGCSAYEPKPSWQTDTGCAHRTEADVSAVGDPNTGVAVYDTSGQTGGWGVWGGTSVATPIMASVYALAGTPVSGTYPSSYPYANTSALNDVTTGSNGSCSPSYLCTAGAGYDGPTGLGTPQGVAAFTTGPHGVVSGTVTDSSTGSPVSGAKVTIGNDSTTSGTNGAYTLTMPVGTYTVSVSDFGYQTQTVSGVAVTDGGTITENFALQTVPSVTVTGLVTDGSGQGWPLYAKVAIPGTPASTYTDPKTGEYSLTLPENSTYNLTVDPVYTGYQETTQSVTVGTGSTAQNVSVPVDATTCAAPGYKFNYNGSTETFDGTTAPGGWSVVNSATSTGGWDFTDSHGQGNLTGGSGGFAEAYSNVLGAKFDTALVSPVENFSGDATPYVQFNSDLFGWFGDVENVDVSIDGGSTWSSVWQSTGYPGTGVTDTAIPLPMAAGQSDVQVRFHYVSNFGYYWELDNVFLGNRSCDPIPGGLVEGTVTDGNTKAGVNGAKVTSVSSPTVTATTGPADPSTGEGFYHLFMPGSGSQQFTAAKNAYASLTKSVTVASSAVTQANYTLQAGQLKVTPASVSKTIGMGNSASANLTFKNTGKEPVNVKLFEQSGSFTLQGEPARTGNNVTSKGAPLDQVKGTFSPLSAEVLAKTDPAALKQRATAAQPSDAPWVSIANYPTGIMDNAAATDTTTGDVYSAGGVDSSLSTTSAASVYDPSTQAWTALPSMPTPTEAPVAAFINGKLYVTGGWASTGNPTGAVQIYTPSTQTWSTGASEPTPLAGSGVTVLGGELYAIGGCDVSSCDHTDVQVYNPATDSWSTGAAYPTPISWEGCGAVSGNIYCAGGTTGATTDTAAAYEYNPGTGSWSSLPPMPADLWAMGYTAANGELLLSGGVTNGFSTLTNQGYAYNPSAGTWTALPNANTSDYRGGSACGMYRIGGSSGGFSPQAVSEQLPGYASCGVIDVPWMSESANTLTLQPGASATVAVTLNAGDTSVTQPGTYTASLAVSDDTPYSTPAVGVSMIATPPKTWGKFAGTITGTSCAGTTAPIAGATVEVDSWASSYTLKTSTSGGYALWLDQRNNPLTVIVAKDGWQPVTGTVKITKGVTTTVNYTLKPDSC